MFKSIYLLTVLHCICLSASALTIVPAKFIRHGWLWMGQILLTEWFLLPILTLSLLSSFHWSFSIYLLVFGYVFYKQNIIFKRTPVSLHSKYKKAPFHQVLFHQLFPFRPPTTSWSEIRGLEVQEIADAHMPEIIHDLYTVPQPKALVIHLHGGAWKHGSSKQLSYFFKFFLNQKINVLSLNYPKLPNVDLETLSAQVEKSFLQGSQLCPDLPIYVLGRSAGGHLALHLGNKFNQLIGKVIALYPITDLQSFYDNGSGNDILSTPQLVKTAVGDNLDPNKMKSLSPAPSLSAASPEVLIVHGENDPVVPIQQSDFFFEKAQNAGASVTYLRFKYATHGFDAILGSSTTFFIYYLKDFLQGTSETATASSHDQNDE